MKKSRPLSIVGVLSAALLLYIVYFVGCTQSKTTEQAMSPERKKAIEDSLRKIKEFEIQKYWSTAYEYYKNENYPEAKHYIWRVINLDPEMRLAEKFHYRDIHARLANCYVHENKPDSVEFSYREGLKFFPDDAYLHENLGFILRRKNQSDEAIEHYKKVAELEPEKSATYKILGDLYRRTRQNEQAIEAYEDYVQLVPDDRDAQETLTGLYRATGRGAEALQKKEELLVQHPDDASLMFELAITYFDQGNFTKSLSMFNRLIEKEPDNLDALDKMAQAYLNLEQYTRAVNIYKKILDLDSNNIDVICAVADVYRLQSNYTTARNWARRAQRVSRSSGLAFITVGMVYQESAKNCSAEKGSFDFDDRLVYEMAHKEFRKGTRDPNYAERARRRMTGIESLLPTTEDRFMNTYSEPKNKCYSWIK